MARTAGTMIWSEMVGRTLGPYEVVAKLGRGGAAYVYRARSPESGQVVAIKVIPNDADDPQMFVRRFQLEAQVVRALDHPNIVKVYGEGETEDLVYLVMQCVEGGTLRQRIRQGTLEQTQAINYAIQMAHALHHAHQHGVVHRDVKPSNMLLDEQDPNHLLLTDFGIAKIQGLRGITKSGTVMGTPEYMSPEQAENRESDPRSDIYSLGCVVYELLTGRPPFLGSHSSSVLYQHVTGAPAYMRGFNPAIPKSLCRVVDRALAKDPDARFPTAEHFARALAPFAEPGYESVASEPLSRSTFAPSTFSPLVGPPDAAGHDLPTRPASPERLSERLPWPSPVSSPSAGDLPEPAATQPTSEGRGEADVSDLAREETVRLGAAPVQVAQSATQASVIDDATRAEGEDYLAATLGTTVINEGEHDLFASPLMPAATRSQIDLDSLVDVSKSEAQPDEPQPPAGSEATARPRVTTRPAVIPMPATSTAALATLARSTSRPLTAPAESALWPKTLAETAGPGRQPRRRAVRIALGVVSVLALVLSGSLVASATGLVTLPTSRVIASAPAQTATLTATLTPSPTVTVLATTPVTTPQQLADQRAYASFRAAALGSGRDSACSNANASTSFVKGESVYINLCASAHLAAGSVSVVVRPTGATVCTLSSLQADSSYYCHSDYGLSPGHYEMVVTMHVDGVVATARDLAFTVTG